DADACATPAGLTIVTKQLPGVADLGIGNPGLRCTTPSALPVRAFVQANDRCACSERCAGFVARHPAAARQNPLLRFSPPRIVNSIRSRSAGIFSGRNRTAPSARMHHAPKLCRLETPASVFELIVGAILASSRSRGSIQWIPEFATSTISGVLAGSSV